MIQVMHRGVFLGKFPDEVIVQGIRVGFFQKDDLGRRPGSDDWKPLVEMLPSGSAVFQTGYEGEARFKELRSRRESRLLKRALNSTAQAESTAQADDSISTGYILYIEDDRPTATAFTYLLKKEGLSVKHFSTGSAALDYFRENAKTCLAVILDLDLPDMPGADLIPEISEKYAHVPILVLSGLDDVKERLYLYTSGAYAVISKPCDSKQFISTLKGFLHMSQIESAQEVL